MLPLLRLCLSSLHWLALPAGKEQGSREHYRSAQGCCYGQAHTCGDIGISVIGVSVGGVLVQRSQGDKLAIDGRDIIADYFGDSGVVVCGAFFVDRVLRSLGKSREVLACRIIEADVEAELFLAAAKVSCDLLADREVADVFGLVLQSEEAARGINGEALDCAEARAYDLFVACFGAVLEAEGFVLGHGVGRTYRQTLDREGLAALDGVGVALK